MSTWAIDWIETSSLYDMDLVRFDAMRQQENVFVSLRARSDLQTM